MRHESFETPGDVRLALRFPSGTIELDVWDEPRTDVELRATRDTEDLQEIINGARIDVRPYGEGHEVTVDVHRKRFSLLDFMRGELQLHVRAPRAADIDVVTASADVIGRGTFGALKLQTASGDVSFDELTGEVDVKAASADVELGMIGGRTTIATASGDVGLRNVGGDLVVRSASGDVQVDDAHGSVTIQTASGDLRVGSVVAGRVTTQSASGDQTLGISRGSRAFIDAKTMSGDATSELEIGDVPPAGDGPEVEVRATSMSGDIHIVRA